MVAANETFPVLSVAHVLSVLFDVLRGFELLPISNVIVHVIGLPPLMVYRWYKQLCTSTVDDPGDNGPQP